MKRSDTGGKVVPFSSGAAEEASLWLARLDRGLSEAEREQLSRWLLHRANAAALHELAAFWNTSELLLDLPMTQHMQSRRRWLAVAAFMVAAIGLSLYFYLPQLWPANTPQFERNYRTAVGEHVTEILPDGSTLTLNTNTEVQVRYLEHERVARLLRGEAHFMVAHATERPFGVRVGEHIVQAVGTAFNVRVQTPDDIEVMVTDGVVRILNESEAAPAASQAPTQWWLQPALGGNLVKGQVARLDEEASAAPLAVTQLDAEGIEVRLAWQRGELVFEGEPLRTVLDEFSRYTTTRFMLASESMATVRVGGFFKAGDIDGLLATLDEDFRIRAERVTNGLILLLPAE
jgi:transmembrane sensor